jgi:hypothetical protein
MFDSKFAAVKVHSVDTDRRVVLDTQVNVLANAEAEVASLAEIPLAQLIFFDFQSSLQNFLGFWAAYGDMHGDLLIASDTKRSDSVSSLACFPLGVLLCESAVTRAHCRQAFGRSTVQALWQRE